MIPHHINNLGRVNQVLNSPEEEVKAEAPSGDDLSEDSSSSSNLSSSLSSHQSLTPEQIRQKKIDRLAQKKKEKMIKKMQKRNAEAPAPGEEELRQEPP